MYYYVMLGFLARGTDGDVAGSRKSYAYAVVPVPPPPGPSVILAYSLGFKPTEQKMLISRVR